MGEVENATTFTRTNELAYVSFLDTIPSVRYISSHTYPRKKNQSSTNNLPPVKFRQNLTWACTIKLCRNVSRCELSTDWWETINKKVPLHNGRLYVGPKSGINCTGGASTFQAQWALTQRRRICGIDKKHAMDRHASWRWWYIGMRPTAGESS